MCQFILQYGWTASGYDPVSFLCSYIQMYRKDGSVTQMSVVTVGYSMFVVPLRIVTCVGLVNKFMQNILGYPDSSGKDQMA